MIGPTIGVIIPTYEMHGIGSWRLQIGLQSIVQQADSVKSVAVIDSSENNLIWDTCKSFASQLPLTYVRLKGLRYGEKLNVGLRYGLSDVIKILNQDDYLAHNNVIGELRDRYRRDEVIWSADPTVHTKNDTDFFQPHIPHVNRNLYRHNTVSSPSVIALRSNLQVFFDSRLHSRIDTDFYARMVRAYGKPRVGNQISTIQFLGSHQVSKHLKPRHYLSDRLLTFHKRLSGVY